VADTSVTHVEDGPDQVWRIGAYAICRRRGEVLVVRASSRTAIEGAWFLPGGGIEFGEPPERAVLRELREETGLTGRDPRLATVCSDLHVRANGTRLFAIRLIYDVDVDDDGPLSFERHGTSDEARWVPVEQLAALGATPYVLRALGLSAK
jgi:8-oxo-dGTP diphosphatase